MTSRLFPLLRYDRRKADLSDAPPELVPTGLSSEEVTVAEVMAHGGYETLAVFTNPHHHEQSNFAKGFAHSAFLPPAANFAYFATGDQVVATFDAMEKQVTKERPIFAYLHFMDVHYPYFAPSGIADSFIRSRGEDKYVNGKPPAGRYPSAEDVALLTERYDAAIRYWDTCLAKLIHKLSTRRDGRRTIVLITSDHGEEFLEHGGLGHGHSAHPELLRVPLIVYELGRTSGGVSNAFVRGIDVAPTIAGLGGVSAPDVFEGSPFIGNMPRGDGPDGRDASYAWHGDVRGLTTPNYHLAIDFASGERWLYAHHGQSVSQGALRAMDDPILRQLEPAVISFEERLRSAYARGTASAHLGSSISRKRAEQLEALGYVDKEASD